LSSIISTLYVFLHWDSPMLISQQRGKYFTK